MKAQILASLAFAGSSLAFPSLERRQGGEFKGILNAPTKVVQKPFKYTETQGTLRSNSKHVTVVYGPYNVPKSGVSVDWQDIMRQGLLTSVS
jgi:hypothetical protein